MCETIKNIHYKILILLATLIIFPNVSFSQYKWTVYTGDPTFMTLEDSIDQGRIIYHRSAENSSSTAGNRGVLFDTTFFAFPSLTGSFSWSQVRVNIGKISFYPHIYTLDQGKSSLAVALLYNISRVSPVRGIRTRPSFSPTTLLQLEKEKMNFQKVKLVSEGFSTDLVLQARNQETELSLSDYDVNYTYWLKSIPDAAEVTNLRSFFDRPLKTFKIRAYSDKGYLDTTLTGPKVPIVGDVFVKSIDLYQRLIDPNYVNRDSPLAQKPTEVKAVQAPKTAPKTAPTKKPVPKQPVKKRRKVVTKQPQKVQKKVVTTNKRAQQRRIVKPK